MRNILLSALIILLTHFQEGITGFGGSVTALPFLNLTIGLKSAVQLLALFGWVMALYIVLRSLKSINWRNFGFIALWSGIGLPVGILLFDFLPAVYLSLMLGTFMVGVGIHGNRQLLCRRPPESNGECKNIWMKLLLLTGGVFQGAFGTGGPCIVIYTAKTIPDKSFFRATLSMLWLIMNSFRLIFWSVKGNFWTPELCRNFIIILPFMIFGLLLGDYFHHKVSDKLFKAAVYSLLAVSGIIMLVNNIIRLTA